MTSLTIRKPINFVVKGFRYWQGIMLNVEINESFLTDFLVPEFFQFKKICVINNLLWPTSSRMGPCDTIKGLAFKNTLSHARKVKVLISNNFSWEVIFDCTNPDWQLFHWLDSVYSREIEKCSSLNIVGAKMHHFREGPLSFHVCGCTQWIIQWCGLTRWPIWFRL